MTVRAQHFKVHTHMSLPSWVFVAYIARLSSCWPFPHTAVAQKSLSDVVKTFLPQSPKLHGLNSDGNTHSTMQDKDSVSFLQQVVTGKNFRKFTPNFSQLHGQGCLDLELSDSNIEDGVLPGLKIVYEQWHNGTDDCWTSWEGSAPFGKILLIREGTQMQSGLASIGRYLSRNTYLLGIMISIPFCLVKYSFLDPI